MTKFAQDITLSNSRNVPLDKLVLRRSNVCRVKAGIRVEELAEDNSLAENMHRSDLHALSHFRVFIALRKNGQGDEKFAAAFFVTPQVIKQRLKHTALAPALLELYTEDENRLEQLIALTVNPKHERQVQVKKVIRSSPNEKL